MSTILTDARKSGSPCLEGMMMRALHLKKRGNRWHYYRNRPKRFEDVEHRPVITFALHTDRPLEARAKAAQISYELDEKWNAALERGISLKSDDKIRCHAAARRVNRSHGLPDADANNLSDSDLLLRLRLLLQKQPSPNEQKALLGLIQKPELTMDQAMDRFWGHIADEYQDYSHDQIRTKKNVFLRAVRNLQKAVGSIGLYEVNRSHAIEFRKWWMEKKQKEGLTNYSAKREITALRRIFHISYHIDGLDDPNPFVGVRLKAEKEKSRKTLTREQVQRYFLEPGCLDGLSREFQLLIFLMINTGA